jgi:type III secretion protein U
MFSRQSLVELGRSALVATCVLWIAWSALRHSIATVSRLPRLAAPLALAAGFDLALAVSLRAAGVVALLGACDYLLERRAHLRRLRMSKEEVKREHKEAEGDPRHKARRKALHRALLNGTLARGVQKATAVVLNPTHIAVALRYEPADAGAPTVVAKGEGEQAARIRALARRYQVPMVRDVPLARALVRCDVGEEIPEELFQAAAAVLRQVFDAGARAAQAARRSP